MKGKWIKAATNRASVVFVHGFISSGDTCWKHDNGTYWPDLLRDTIGFDDLGIYVFTYKTGLFSGSFSLGDIVDSLKEYMVLDGLFEQERIIFVCHSMGGIVVRKFLVERENDLTEKGIEIGLFLIASPSLGAKYANWLRPLTWLLDHSQAVILQLGQNNTWLTDLDKNFYKLKESNKLKIRGKELVEDKFVIGKKLLVLIRLKQVVEPFSAYRYFPEPYKVPDSDHFSIVKPESANAIQHRLLCHFISQMIASTPPGFSQNEALVNQVTATQDAPMEDIFSGKRVPNGSSAGNNLQQFRQAVEGLKKLKDLNYIDEVETPSESRMEKPHVDIVMTGDLTALGRKVVDDEKSLKKEPSPAKSEMPDQTIDILSTSLLRSVQSLGRAVHNQRKIFWPRLFGAVSILLFLLIGLAYGYYDFIQPMIKVTLLPPPPPEISNYVPIMTVSLTEASAKIGASFKIHFNSIESGYLYFIGSNVANKEVLYCPLGKSAHLSSAIYEVPSPEQGWIRFFNNGQMSYRVIFFSSLEKRPAFLPEQGEYKFTEEQARELEIFMAKWKSKIKEITLNTKSKVLEQVVFVPASVAMSGMIVFDLKVI